MPTVLVVDDESPVRELTARMLQEAGYDTMLAVDGRDAWRQLRREATTGYSADDLRARGLEQAPVPLLTKPFTNDELVTAVARLLGGPFHQSRVS